MKNSIPFNRSIKTKLLLALISTNLVALLIMTLLSYKESYSVLNKNFQTTSQQTLEQTDRSLEEFLNGVEMQLYSLSNSNAITNVVNSTDGEHTEFILQLTHSLKNAFDTSIAMENVYFVQQDTKDIFTYPEIDTTGLDATTATWYQNSVSNTASFLWTEPYIDSITGLPIITVSKAVLDNNQIIGVVAIDIDLSIVSAAMSDMKIGNAGYIFITDASGTLVAHPNSSIINTDEITKLNLWDKVKNNDSGFTSYDYNGVSKYATFTTNAITGWKVIASLEQEELTNDTNNILSASFLVLILVLVVVTVISLLFANALIKNITILLDVMAKAAKGDLTAIAKITSKDEIKALGDSFNGMLTSIRELISNVKASSLTVSETSHSMMNMSAETSSAINDIATTISEVAVGTNEQARDIEQNSLNIGQLAHKLGEITISTNEVGELSLAAQSRSNDGLKQIKKLVENSETTAKISANVNEIMIEVNHSSKEINSITDTINSIAEQTNLLALNAAIEAARAGESGRGFAVVAEEIRKLAEQSSKATSDIGTLINTMNLRTDEAVKAMDNTKNVLAAQNESVIETDVIFQNILTSVENLSNKVTIISKSVNEIDAQKNQIVESTANLSAISEQISASTEEVSASTQQVSATTEISTQHARDLSTLADQLAQQIDYFKL